METLRFLVNGQTIKKDPSSPFNKMVAGTSNYYELEFVFDSSWRGYSCVACFKTNGFTKYYPLVKSKIVIPAEVLEYKQFMVSVVGAKGTSRLITGENRVIQTGGK